MEKMVKGLVTIKWRGKVVMKVFCNCQGEGANYFANVLAEKWPLSDEEAYDLAKSAGFGEMRCLRVQTEDEVICHSDLEYDQELEDRIRATFQEERTNPLGEMADDPVAIIDVTQRMDALRKKARTLELIALRPENFQWLFRGTLYNKEQLLGEVSGETETGKLLILAAEGIGVEPAKQGSFMLGKRGVCLKCGTELLVTKAGKGLMVCCQQNMDIKQPKPIPSSD